MDKNKHYNIALVLYTHGLDYDDRIRKEILSIKSLYSNVDFKIFAVEPKNREEEGITSYGVRYRIPYLKSREKYASVTHTVQKAWDFYKAIKKDLKVFDAVWCADPETFIFVLMLHDKPITWDLHELPLVFMSNPVMKMLFKHLEQKCNVMVHANEARLNLLNKEGYVSNIKKHYVLRNYPQFNEIDSEYNDLYQKFDKWVGDSKCVYLQGLNNASRAAYQTISAVMAFKELKAVVVGDFDKEALAKLKSEYGDEFTEKIFFTGMVKQLKTPQYIRHCFMSLVFYRNTSPNNYFCEANRLYQNIINGNPVVVGCNPPMRDLVNAYNFGISIDDDGSDIEKIKSGITELMSRYNELKANIEKNSNVLFWDSQKEIHKSIITKLFE